MFDFRPVNNNCDTIFVYDGTLFGFYCCVYECFRSRLMPADIIPQDVLQPSMFEQRSIVTDGQKAERVRASIRQKLSLRAKELIENVFLSCMEKKELALLRLIILLYKNGPSILNMLGHETVAPVMSAERHLLGERHLLLGFIRFSDYDGTLAAAISPKNFILPFIAGHFVSRFRNCDFIIYDKTHHAALIYQGNKTQIISARDFVFPEADETERHYRDLWKRFYKTIAIESRTNPRCRMSHMPKRYWANMLEVADEL